MLTRTTNREYGVVSNSVYFVVDPRFCERGLRNKSDKEVVSVAWCCWLRSQEASSLHSQPSHRAAQGAHRQVIAVPLPH